MATKKTSENGLRTCEQARAELDRQGLSIADFARMHELDYGTTYQVITGAKKGRRGEAHRAAVLLGIKEGVIQRGAAAGGAP